MSVDALKIKKYIMANEKIKPTQPGGFKDYLPKEMIARNKIISTIRDTFERFGFDPLETPGMEREEVLTGNQPDFNMFIYRTMSTGRGKAETAQQSEKETALRFDLTIPLARVIAANRDMRLPFKRYQIGNVWRGERSQAGRFREFLQFDADIVGSATMTADAEIIAIMVETMNALDIGNFEVCFNNRKILNGLPEYAGFDKADGKNVLRIIDKLPKIGKEAVLRELGKPKKDQEVSSDEGSADTEASYGLGLNQESVQKISEFLDLKGNTDELISAISSLFAGITVVEEGISEMKEIISALREMKIPEKNWKLDLSIARGLAYYTGPVFETFLTDYPEIGSVFSGGRYDNLVNRFMDGTLPSVGASVGVDRLFAALVSMNKIELTPTLAQVLVTGMDSKLMPEYLSFVSNLRKAGVRTILWIGEEYSFKAQMAYAVGQEIPVVVIMGEDENKLGEVSVKDMRKREQKTVPQANLVDTVKMILEK